MEAQAKIIRIHPIKMADIYFSRKHFGSLKEVNRLYRDAEDGSESRLYWGKVLEILKKKVEVKSYD